MHWTRPALTTKVAQFGDRYEGDEFVQAVADFAETLDPDDVKTLQTVLLEAADEKYKGHFADMDWGRRRRR